MDNTLVILLTVAALWLVINWMKNRGVKKMSPADAQKSLDTQRGIILDVRTKDEYLERHIPKSILIPLDRLEEEVEKKLPDKNSEIIVYCASGSRSAIAARLLAKLGYTNVYNLGSINNWTYQTVSGRKLHEIT